jgi:hypothetical protein
MTSIIQERHLTEAQKEQLEMQKYAPEKLDPDLQFDYRPNTGKTVVYLPLTKEECAKLLEESNKSIAEDIAEDIAVRPKIDYPVYSLEEVQKILTEQVGDNKWDSTKTKESDRKTRSTTKRTKRTKNSR